MRKFFKEHSWWLCLIPVALFVLVVIGVNIYRISQSVINLWEMSNENIGKFILNIFTIPFAIFGGVNIFRGFCAVLEKDGEKFDYKKDWKFSIYLLMTIAGYFAFFCAIAVWIK